MQIMRREEVRRDQWREREEIFMGCQECELIARAKLYIERTRLHVPPWWVVGAGAGAG